MTRKQGDIVRAGFDRVSEAYRPDATPDEHGEYAAWVQLLVQLLPRRAPVLDIGCGCGLPATKLMAEWFDVTGVDFSEVQIARAKRLVPSAEFLCEDITGSSFPEGTFAAVVSFYAIIHMPLEEHPRLFRNMASWIRPGGYFLGIVGHDAWTGSEPTYLGIEGGEMCWSHADEATNLRWLQDSGLRIHWTRFVPEQDGGHALVLAQKPLGC